MYEPFRPFTGFRYICHDAHTQCSPDIATWYQQLFSMRGCMTSYTPRANCDYATEMINQLMIWFSIILCIIVVFRGVCALYDDDMTPAKASKQCNDTSYKSSSNFGANLRRGVPSPL